LMNDLVTPEARTASQTIRELMATYLENEDLINIGAYRQGSNPKIDLAIRMREEINQFLTQQVEESSSVEAAGKQLLEIAAKAATPVITRPAVARK
ncbi:MAG: EscN/YscN/HrcN family type III secretion system ATPase, partial [Pirellulaceae bacterium]